MNRPRFRRPCNRAAAGLQARALVPFIGCLFVLSCTHVREALTLTAPDNFAPLSLMAAELPADYGLVEDGRLLSKMGMASNPGFIGNPAEHMALAAHGITSCFAAIYGVDGRTRLILNGLCFDEAEALDAFTKFQQNKARRVIAFRKAQDKKLWLLLVARDPDVSYGSTELDELRTGIKRYQRRLELEPPLFDQFTAASEPG